MPLHRISFAVLLALLVLPGATPAAAGPVDYPTQIAGQLAAAMDLSRQEGKDLEGVTFRLDLTLDTQGRIVQATTLDISGAREDAALDNAERALARAIAHHRETPFYDLDPADYDTWGRMQLTFQLGLYIGGYQP